MNLAVHSSAVLYVVLPSGYPNDNTEQIFISLCWPSRILDRGENTRTAVSCLFVVPQGRLSQYFDSSIYITSCNFSTPPHQWLTVFWSNCWQYFKPTSSLTLSSDPTNRIILLRPVGYKILNHSWLSRPVRARLLNKKLPLQEWNL
jgi:hypothetical protein